MAANHDLAGNVYARSKQLLPIQHVVRLLVERPFGIDAGMHEEMPFRFVPALAIAFEELPVSKRHIHKKFVEVSLTVECVLDLLFLRAIGQERGDAAAPQSKWIGAPAGFEHHRVVIAAQCDETSAIVQRD